MGIWGCSSDETPHPSSPSQEETSPRSLGEETPPFFLTVSQRQVVLGMSPVPPPPPRPTNRFADDSKAAALGKQLFFDTGFSANGKVSCATCHIPSLSFTDGKVHGEGMGPGTRNTPSVLAAPWSPWLFWDGRKDSLWSQALGPLEARNEHGFSRMAVVERLSRVWSREYEALFGPQPDLKDSQRFPRDAHPDSNDPNAQAAWTGMAPADQQAVNTIFVNTGKVLEAFQRTLRPGESPFDRFVAALRKGDDEGGGALSPSAMRGLVLFVGPAACVNCHHGPLLTDHAFHNLGLPPTAEVAVSGPDPGRGKGAQQVKEDPFNCDSIYSDQRDCPELRYLDPSFPDFLGAFRTPTLRDVGRTAPYMHTGQFSSLSQVLQFYNTLPGQPLLGHRELTLKLPELSGGDLVDLESFLESLTGPPPEITAPLPRK